MTTYTHTVPPTEVGQRVRLIGYGGNVRLWMAGKNGTVSRFTRAGNPVIVFDEPSSDGPLVTEVTDTYGCAARINDDDTIMRPGG
jgi:hypothetical protein